MAMDFGRGPSAGVYQDNGRLWEGNYDLPGPKRVG